jgi:anti-anti-sigma factor
MTDGFAVEVVDGVICVSGDLDAQTSSRLDDVINAQLERGCEEVVLDLSDLDFVDSSGLRSMVLARGPQGEGRVVLRSPSSSVVRLLDITGLTEVFVIEA